MSGRKFWFCVLTRNHLRMYMGAVKRLIEQGFDCRYVHLDDEFHIKAARPALAAHGLSSVPFAEANARFAPGDIIVVANDWVPDSLVGLINDRKQRRLIVVGCIEGCRFSKENHYRNVDHVLGWGLSCLKYYPQTGIAVGSPEIEWLWRDRPHFAEPPFAAVNYKFTFERQAGREQWTNIVKKACEVVGIEPRFTRHPADVGADALNLKSEELSDLLPECSLLISRPSTAIYQAQAAGKPVVFLPMHNEDLVEFAEPMGAYERPTSPDDLVRAIRRALAERSSYRERCRTFFEHHVSIDPTRPATERMAAALSDIHVAYPRA